MARRKLSIAEQSKEAYLERGTIVTPIGYASFPWQTHPDDIYLRVPPNGPFTQAWQGIQRDNLISHVGTKRASMYSAEPVYLHQTKEQTSRVQQNNYAAQAFGMGPDLIASMDQEYQTTGQTRSFASMVISKLLGRT